MAFPAGAGAVGGDGSAETEKESERGRQKLRGVTAFFGVFA